MNTLRNFIGGKYQAGESDDSSELVDPASGEVIDLARPHGMFRTSAG